MPDLGGLWTAFVNNPIVQLGVRFAGLYVLGLYLATVFWTVRDAQQRTENRIMPYFAGLLVVVTWILGLFLYLIVRPRETMAEVYERSLAEESLLAEVEKNELCPVCRDRVEADWLVCPNCRTRLHRVCPSCNRLADPTWPLCAYCGHEFGHGARSAHAPAAATATKADGSRRRDVTAEQGALGASNS
jgi:hypothetical protein